MCVKGPTRLLGGDVERRTAGSEAGAVFCSDWDQVDRVALQAREQSRGGADSPHSPRFSRVGASLPEKNLGNKEEQITAGSPPHLLQQEISWKPGGLWSIFAAKQSQDIKLRYKIGQIYPRMLKLRHRYNKSCSKRYWVTVKVGVKLERPWVGSLSEFVFIRGSFMAHKAGTAVGEMSNRWFESSYFFIRLHRFPGISVGRGWFVTKPGVADNRWIQGVLYSSSAF